MSPCQRIFTVVSVALVSLAAQSVPAASVFWDPTGTLSNNGSGGGTWDTNTTTAWWISGGTNTAWTDTTGINTAIFGGPAGTYSVTVSGNNVTNGITFNSAGYTLSSGTITLAGTSPTITANASDTVGSVLTGSNGLTISGSGSVLLSGNNTFTGGTTIMPGAIVQAGASNAVGTYSSSQTTTYGQLIVQSGATFDLNGQQNVIVGVTIAGTGTSGQGALVNNGAAQSSSNQDTPNIALSADATIGGTGNFYEIFAGHAADTLNLAGHTLTKTGTNTFFLDNTTVTAGTINIAQGTFSQFNASNGSAAAFTIAPGATFALNGSNFTVGSLGGTGGTVSIGANALTFGGLGFSTSFAGTISGTTGSITKLGSGALYLSGSNNYSGGTTISGGSVQLSNAAALGASNGSLAMFGTLLDLNGNSLGVGNFSGSGTVDNVSVGGQLTLTVGNGGSGMATYSGALKNTTGTLSVVQNGTGALFLTGSNSYRGTTTINGGALVFATSAALPTAAAPNSITIAGGALGLAGPYTTSNAWFTSGLVAPNPTSGALAIVGTSNDTINLASGPGANYANLTLSAAGNATFSGTFTPSSSTYALGGTYGVLTFASSIGGNNSLAIAPSSTVILTSASNSYVGPTTIPAASALQIGDGATNKGSISGPVTNSGTLQFATGTSLTYTASNAVSGTGGLLKTGAGILVLTSTSNSYSGGTTIGTSSLVGGTITLGANNALPVGSSLTVNTIAGNNTGLNLSTFNQNLGNVTIAGGAGASYTPISSSGGSLVLSGTFTMAIAHANPDWPALVAAPIDLNGTTRTFAVGWGNNNDSSDLGDLHLNGIVSTSTGLAGITFTPWSGGATTGGITFGAANTYAGPTALQGAMILGLNVNNAFPNNSAFIQGAGTKLDLTDFGSKTAGVSTGMGSLTGSGAIALGTTGVLTIGYDNTSPAAYLGVISGGGQIVKTGAGVLDLAAANTYTGGTTLGGGTLALGFNVTGSTTSNILATTGPLTFAGGALALQGSSGVTNSQTVGNVTVSAGGSSLVLVPGSTNSLTLTTGSTWTHNAGGTVNLSLGGGTLTVGSMTGSNGIIGGYATINGSDWAAVSSSAVTAYSGYVTTLPASGNNSTNNYSLANSNSAMTGTSGLQINSLKLTTTQTGTFTIPTGDTLTLSGNGLLFTGSNAYTISGGSITAGNGVGTYDVIVQQFGSAALTMSSAITNNGANAVNLVKAGSGNLVLATTNTYTGSTYLNGGVLLFSGTSQLGAAATPLVFGGGTLRYNGNTDDVSTKTVTINGAGATIDTNGQNVTYAGAIGNSGAGGLTKAGAGMLTLSASNPFNGAFSLNGGSVSVASIGNYGAASPLGLGINVNFGGGALQYTGASASTNRLFTFNSGGGTIGLPSGTTLTLTSPTSGAGGLTLAGSGSLVLASAPGYTGQTVLSGGTLTAPGSLTYRPSNVLNISSAAGVYQSLGTLNLGVNQSTSDSVDVNGSGTLVLASSSGSRATPDLYFGPDSSGNTWGGAAMTVTTLNLGNAQRYIDANSDHNGFAPYNTSVDAYISSNITGSGGITYFGNFYSSQSITSLYTELVLAGSNSFSGPLEIDQGAVFLDSAHALTQANQVTLVANNSAAWSHLFIMGNNATISNLSSSGTAQANAAVGNGVLNMNQACPAATLTVNETTNTTFAGTVGDRVDDFYNSGAVIPGALSLTKTGAATLTLSGSNSSYSGTTTINQGTLAFGYEATSGTLSGLGTIPSIATADNIVLNGGTLSAYNTLTLNANRGIGLGPTGGTLGGSGALDVAVGQTESYGGVIASAGNSGTDNLAKTGKGALVLGGSNTFNGTASVNAGTLFVNGSLPSSGTVNVAAGASLGGAGTVGNAIVASSGAIDVSQIGGNTFTLATLTLGQNAGNSAILNLSGSNFSNSFPANPAITVTASNGLTANGGSSSVSINVGGSLAVSGTYSLIGFNGAIGGSGSAAFAMGTTPTLSNRQFGTLVDTGSQLDWVVTGSFPVWTGANSGLWLGGTNWRLSGSTTATDFLPSDTVVFDDTAGTGTTAVTISGSGNVSPLSVTFNNNSLNYSIAGPNGISGSATLALNGAAAVLISNSNSYTGGTTVNSGLLQVANNAALGSGPLTISGAALTSGGTAAYTLANPLVIGGNVTLGDPVNNGALSFTAAAGTLATATALTVNSPITIYGNLSSGTGIGLTVSGSSILTLAGSNTYPGATTITGGTLQLGAGGGSGSLAGIINVQNAGTLAFARSDASVTVANNITGNGGLVFSGIGVASQSSYSLTGTDSSFSGPIALVNSRVQAASATNFGTGQVTITQGGGVYFTGGTFANTFKISGTGWQETAADGYLGAIRLQGATISGPVVLTGNARITAYNSSGTISGPISEVNPGTVLTIGSTAGSDTLTLSGSNTYSGGTVLQSGGLTITSSAALGSGPLVLSNTAAFTFNVANTASVTLANNIVLPSPGSSQTYVFLKNSSGQQTGTLLLLSGTISGGNSNTNIELNSNTGGDSTTTYEFSASNTFTVGLINLNRGGIIVTNPASLGNPTNLVYLDGNANSTLGDLRFTVPMTFPNPIQLLSTGSPISASGNAVTLSGLIIGSAFHEVGSGVLTLTNTNTYTGGTTISTGGTLSASYVTANGTASNIGTAGITLDGGTFQYTGGAQATNRTLTLTASGGAIDASGMGPLNLSNAGAIALSGTATHGLTLTGSNAGANTLASSLQDFSNALPSSLTKSGPGTWVITGSADSYTGGTNLQNGTLAIGTNNSLPTAGTVTFGAASTGGTLDLAGNYQKIGGLAVAGGATPAQQAIINSSTASSATLEISSSASSTFGGTIQDSAAGGSGAIAVTLTAGTLAVTGTSNTYSGGTNLNGGLLNIAGDGSLGWTPTAAISNVSISGGILQAGANLTLAANRGIAIGSSGGTIDNNGFNVSIPGSISGPNPTSNLAAVGAGLLDLQGSVNLGGALTATASTLEIDSALSVAGAAINNATQLTGSGTISLSNSASGLVFNSSTPSTFAGSIGGAGGLTVASGALTLSGTSSYSGPTGVSGTLRLGASNALPFGANTSNVTVNGLLDLAGQTTNVNGLSGSGAVNNSAAAPATLVVGNNNASSTFSGLLQNTGASLGLTKVGNGSLTLNSTNSYSGATSVQGGVLYMGTNGAVTGPVSVTGGTLDATSGGQSFSSLTMGSGGALNLAASNAGNPIVSSGTDAFAGTLNVLGFTGGTEELMSYTSHSGTFGTVTGISGNFQLSYGLNQLDIVAFSTGTPTWSFATSGSWTDGTKWSGLAPPSGVGKAAIVGAATALPLTITLDGPQTLGSLTFTNSGAPTAGYSLAVGSSGSLTLDNSGSTAQVIVNGGSHGITAPVYLVGGNLEVSASNNGNLTVGGNVSDNGAGLSLTLDGDGTGELVLSGTNTFGGSSATATVASGTLVLMNDQALADNTNLTVGDSTFFGGIQPAGASSSAAGSAPGPIAPVPEPSTLALLVAIVAGAALNRRRRPRRGPLS